MDQFKNNNAVVYNHFVEKITNKPDYVKQASEEKPSLDNLPNSAFAYSTKRELPIDTPENTWHSYVYFKSYPEEFSKVASIVSMNFELAIATHGIEDDIKEIDLVIDGTVKSASEVDEDSIKYALSFEKEGSIHNYFPINDEFEIEESAVKLLNQSYKIPIEWIKVACENIVEEAKNYDSVILPKRVRELGEKREVDFEFAEKIASLRKWVVDDEESLELYQDIVKAASEDNETDLEDYIELWIDVDRMHNVKYANGVLSPYDAFYSGMKEDELNKIASDNVIIHDILVPASAFKALEQDKVQKYFSRETADKITELTKQSSAAKISIELEKFPSNIKKDILRLLVNDN